MSETKLVQLTREEKRYLKKAGYGFSSGVSAGRWCQLEEVYLSSGLWTSSCTSGLPRFSCPSRERCDELFNKRNRERTIRPDHRGTVANYFAEGYDRLLSINGTPLRICVVSIDSASWTFDFKTQSGLDSWKTTGMRNQLDYNNLHWSTTRDMVYRLLFGKWPVDSEPTTLCPKLFTHVRALKCNGAQDPRPPLEKLLRSPGLIESEQSGSKRWKPHQGMYELCYRFLEAELNVLQPTILISQGFSRRERSPSTTGAVQRAISRICGCPGQDITTLAYAGSKWQSSVAMWQWQADWGDCILIGTYHPTYWLYKKGRIDSLRDALEPGMAWLRRRLGQY